MLKTLVAVLRADAQDAGEFPLSGYVFVRQVVVFPKGYRTAKIFAASDVDVVLAKVHRTSGWRSVPNLLKRLSNRQVSGQNVLSEFGSGCLLRI